MPPRAPKIFHSAVLDAYPHGKVIMIPCQVCGVWHRVGVDPDLYPLSPGTYEMSIRHSRGVFTQSGSRVHHVTVHAEPFRPEWMARDIANVMTPEFAIYVTDKLRPRIYTT